MNNHKSVYLEIKRPYLMTLITLWGHFFSQLVQKPLLLLSTLVINTTTFYRSKRSGGRPVFHQREGLKTDLLPRPTTQSQALHPTFLRIVKTWFHELGDTIGGHTIKEVDDTFHYNRNQELTPTVYVVYPILPVDCTYLFFFFQDTTKGRHPVHPPLKMNFLDQTRDKEMLK